jgi:hypothetical protein
MTAARIQDHKTAWKAPVNRDGPSDVFPNFDRKKRKVED